MSDAGPSRLQQRLDAAEAKRRAAERRERAREERHRARRRQRRAALPLRLSLSEGREGWRLRFRWRSLPALSVAYLLYALGVVLAVWHSKQPNRSTGIELAAWLLLLFGPSLLIMGLASRWHERPASSLAVTRDGRFLFSGSAGGGSSPTGRSRTCT